MNAAQLFPGEYYAYKSLPPKGRIPLDAAKVRLRYIEQRKRNYDKNRHTVAAITVVDSGREFTVPAREIIMFWDEYEGERDTLLNERRDAEKASKRKSLRRTVLEAMITYRLYEKQIPIVVNVNYGAAEGYVSTNDLMKWLDISEQNIEDAIDKAMEDDE